MLRIIAAALRLVTGVVVWAVIALGYRHSDDTLTVLLAMMLVAAGMAELSALTRKRTD